MTSRLAAIIRALKATLFTPIAVLSFITTTAAVVSVFWLLRAQPSGVAGIWTGTLQTYYCPGINCRRVNLRFVLHVTSDSAGKLGVSFDSLDQGAMGLRGDNVALKGNAFSFDIPSVQGNYQGTLSADSKSLNGIWTQGSTPPT